MYWPEGSYLFNRPNVKHLYNRARRCKVISSIEDIIAVELVGEANNKSNNYHLNPKTPNPQMFESVFK